MSWEDKDLTLAGYYKKYAMTPHDVAIGDIVAGLEFVDQAFRVTRNTRLAIQAGGHVGIYATFLADLFDEVHTFEPVAELRAHLIKNTKDIPNVFVYPEALSSHAGRGRMENGYPQNSGVSQLKSGDEVDVRTIDSFGFKDVSLILLDVEGQELEALKGAEETIKKYHPTIMVEDRGHGPSCDAYLETLGYVLRFKFPFDKVFTWH